MRQITLLSIVVSLIVSCAVPVGAAFALGVDDSGDTQAGLEVQQEIGMPIIENEVIEEPQELQAVHADTSRTEEVGSDVASVANTIPPAPSIEEKEDSSVTIEVPTLPGEELLPPQRTVYVTALQRTNALGLVELYNSDTKATSLAAWRFVAEFTDGGPTCEVPLAGYVLPKTKVLLAREGTAGVQNALSYSCGEPSRVMKSLLLYEDEQLVERLVPPETDEQVWARKNTTKTYLTGDFLQDFEADEQYTVTDGYWYIPPPVPSIQILEVYVNPRTCVVPDESVTCYDYIKLKNISEQDSVDLGEYRLRSGYSNSSASASNTTYSSIVLAPGEVKTLTHDQYGEPISFTANDGSVWFEDIEGVVAYPSEVEPYIDSGLASNKGRSWAYNGKTDSWQWATPAPESEENDFTVSEAGKGTHQVRTLVPCRKDQYRSEETNRCRTIASPNTLVPCREGQYRSEETNRCRSIATAVATLKPCADDQFRNPLTNRCKKIASTEDIALADCGEGRERNPLTNRCRNVAVAGALTDTVPFPVEEIKEGSDQFAGWWALGVVVLAGAGYGMWEWREELSRLGQRARRFLVGGK